ncbi:uncharacterized protein LODBEIA_P45380 [Lodderomyces beijingensis]|uniref:Zn(2)-C6 fungal-type domain-containing protein n=1 Tax=Lodderomyces beijingensis TaxID=1775926 RepID=A0ABP0ZQA3_9ASCO
MFPLNGKKLAGNNSKGSNRTTTKSKKGCLTCKKRRIRCDEGKPSCMNCVKKNVECGGYATNFKWKPFNEATKQPPQTLISNSGGVEINRHLELASLSVVGRSISEINEESERISQGLNPGHSRHSVTSLNSPASERSRSFSIPHSSSSRHGSPISRSYSETFASHDISEFRSRTDLDSLAEAAVGEMEKSGTPVDMMSASTGFSPSQLSPTIMSPSGSGPLIKKDASGHFSVTPTISAILNFAMNPEVIDVPSVETFSPLSLDQIHLSRSASTRRFDMDKSLTRSAEHEQILFLYSEHTSGIMSIKNGHHENPWRNMIVPLAHKYSCLFNSIASMTLFHLAGSRGVVREPEQLQVRAGNYMKRCILELASGLSMMENGIEGELPADIALATCLNLAVSEGWDTHTSSGIAHLKGAKSMINKILSLLKETQASIRDKHRNETTSPTSASAVAANTAADTIGRKGGFFDIQSKLTLIDNFEYEKMVHDCLKKSDSVVIPKSIQFLFNIWIYFEVLAQMTADCNHDDKGIDLVATITKMLHKERASDKSQAQAQAQTQTQSPNQTHGGPAKSPSEQSDASDKVFNFFEAFDNMDFDADVVDPLLGCSQALFSVMGRVANLVSKIRKVKDRDGWKKRNTLNTITQASELRQLLLDWTPNVGTGAIENEEGATSKTWDIASCIATAEAYRHSTLLLLHQAVPEIPSLSSHSLAEKILILLASIPVSSNLSIVHIFPLLVASCEAEVGEERDWCKSRWTVLSEKMWIGNVDRAFEVVKEAWRRKDEESHEQKETQRHHPKDGLMSLIYGDSTKLGNKSDDGGIESRTHWTNIMKEWGWEVLLG